MLQMSPRVDLDGAKPKISSGSITWVSLWRSARGLAMCHASWSGQWASAGRRMAFLRSRLGTASTCTNPAGRRARIKCCTRGNAGGRETLAVPAGQKGTPRVGVCPVMTEVDVHAEAIESQSCYPASRSDGRPWRDEPVNVREVAIWGTATSALSASQATETCRRPAAAEIGLGRSLIRPRPPR